MNVWLVYCSICIKGTTIVKPPGDEKFVKETNCVICGHRLNAKNGVYRNLARASESTKVDLLEVK